MCGRYYIDDTFQKGLLSDFPSFREQAAAMHIPSGDVRPTDAAPVIMEDRLVRMYEKDQKRIAGGNGLSRDYTDISKASAGLQSDIGNKSSYSETDRQNHTNNNDISITEAHWGFWEDFGAGDKLLINARTETAATRSAFSYAIRSRRCVIPVSGFYEYTPDKEKVSFFREEEKVIYLAGCARWADGWCFVILTTSPNDDVKKVHDRMPVMLRKEDVRKWVRSRRIPTTLTDGWKPPLESFRRYEQLSLFS